MEETEIYLIVCLFFLNGNSKTSQYESSSALRLQLTFEQYQKQCRGEKANDATKQ